MKLHLAQKTIFVILIANVGLDGCAAPGDGYGSRSSSNGSMIDVGCNTGVAAVGGAIIGGLLASGTHRVKGAALGAGLASLACLAWNYKVKQTKTAEQVQNEYKAANEGQLPTESRVIRFDTTFDPNGKMAPGGKVTVSSNIEIVQGRIGRSPVIEQEVELVKPDRSTLRTRKLASEGAGAGAFATAFTMSMPQGVPQGDYPVKTTLYMDGNVVGSNNLNLQVVMAPSGKILASVR